MTLVGFTLSNTTQFYSSMGNPLAMKGFNYLDKRGAGMAQW